MFSDNEQKEIIKVLERHNRLDLAENIECKEVGDVLYKESEELTAWDINFADVYKEYLLYCELGERLKDPGCCYNLCSYYHYDSDEPYYDTNKEKAYFYTRKVIEFGGWPDEDILREMVDLGDLVAIDHFNNFL
jgi:hypothetical protein